MGGAVYNSPSSPILFNYIQNNGNYNYLAISSHRMVRRQQSLLWFVGIASGSFRVIFQAEGSLTDSFINSALIPILQFKKSLLFWS